jgi:hypothetical protein
VGRPDRPGQADRPPPARRWVEQARAGILVAVVGGVFAVVAALVPYADSGAPRPTATAPTPAPGTTTTPPPSGPAGVVRPTLRTGPYLEVRIVNSGTGVATYRGPSTVSRYDDGFLDGDVVRVVCQDRDGEPHTDPDPVPGRPGRWPVWDRLLDGRWLPDLWTDLPKKPGDTPPYGLPNC